MRQLLQRSSVQIDLDSLPVAAKGKIAQKNQSAGIIKIGQYQLIGAIVEPASPGILSRIGSAIVNVYNKITGN